MNTTEEKNILTSKSTYYNLFTCTTLKIVSLNIISKLNTILWVKLFYFKYITFIKYKFHQYRVDLSLMFTV